MFGLNSPMKVLLCLLEEKYIIQLFALQLCEFEQHECLIVIRMGVRDRINLWLGLLRYYIDMTELREVTSYPVLNCLLQFWDQELSIHNIKSPCQTNHQPDLMGERAAFLDIPSIPAVSWVCSSRITSKNYLEGTYSDIYFAFTLFALEIFTSFGDTWDKAKKWNGKCKNYIT